jgi:2-dehydro-3-deoxyphosphogluconate aldolase/(4S)-4-hydroxy-2-oxoglutarate aldolase
VPAGGVDATRESLKAWFDAGVTCVGMGSKLVRKDLVAAQDWEGIASLTRQCLA